jgi:hypothetical protein
MAKKNVSLLVSAAGWIAGLVEKLVNALRERGVTDEEIHGLVTEKGDALIGKIADTIAEFVKEAKNIFHLIIGSKNRTTEEMVEAGKYDWANDDVNSKNFPMRPRPAGKRVIELIEFDHDVSSEEALEEARKQGLEQPDYEDALDFGEQFPEIQRKRPIVFLHKPWQDPDGNLRVLVLSGDSSLRELRLAWFDHGWDRRCVFAFVRK